MRCLCCLALAFLALTVSSCNRNRPHADAAMDGAKIINCSYDYRQNLGIGTLSTYQAKGEQIAPGVYRCQTATCNNLRVNYTVTWVSGADKSTSGYRVSDVSIDRPAIKL